MYVQKEGNLRRLEEEGTAGASEIELLNSYNYGSHFMSVFSHPSMEHMLSLVGFLLHFPFSDMDIFSM
jgi:hypothetical protein